MNITINVDKDMINKVERQLGEFHSNAPSAISKALNRAATNVNSNIKKEVRSKYNIKAGDINETLTKKNSSASNLSAGVYSSGGVIALDKFKVSPKTVNPRRKSPIKIGVKKDSIKAVLGVFVGDINGLKVFKRVSSPRLPIERLFGPSVPQMIGNEQVISQIQAQGQETFQSRLDHEIQRILDKGRRSK